MEKKQSFWSHQNISTDFVTPYAMIHRYSCCCSTKKGNSLQKVRWSGELLWLVAHQDFVPVLFLSTAVYLSSTWYSYVTKGGQEYRFWFSNLCLMGMMTCRKTHVQHTVEHMEKLCSCCTETLLINRSYDSDQLAVFLISRQLLKDLCSLFFHC